MSGVSIFDVGQLYSSAIADVLDGEGVWGNLSPRVKQVSGEHRVIFGRAYTVRWQAARKGADMRAAMSTWDEVKSFLAPDVQDGRGLVYVGGAGEIVDHMALAGGLSATHFENLGFGGMVLGGAVRDAHVLKQRRLPIFATNFVPADTAGAYVVVEAGTHCVIDNVVVRTGDYVFADDSGVVCIPQERAERVIRAAFVVAAEEDTVMRMLEAGRDLVTILENHGRI